MLETRKSENEIERDRDDHQCSYAVESDDGVVYNRVCYRSKGEGLMVYDIEDVCGDCPKKE